MKEIVLFASGSGTNVERIVNYFENHENIRVACVFTNNKNAGVIARCHRLGVPLLCFNRVAFSKSEALLKVLQSFNPDLIVLAGFLWKIPKAMVVAFPNKIVNIHPALLPKYGGKGMYGQYVHQAVKDSGETETGITIHYVNEHYDEGAILFQAQTQLNATDTPDSIAQKVHQLEYEHYPRILETLLTNDG